MTDGGNKSPESESAAREGTASKRAMSEIAASKSVGSKSASENTEGESTDVDHAVVKMLELLDSGILEPGIFGEIVILHANGCARIDGEGICRCDPDLQLLPPRKAHSVRWRAGYGESVMHARRET
ncbi:MAG TPA: hypothetical protein VNF00_04210 [Candidatus Acidoferrales bacterium]|nr:hypothetical protein [Candidatus Acidoferrales bacterium]